MEHAARRTTPQRGALSHLIPATPAGQSGSFEILDANKDGRISMPEASVDPKLVETFSTTDRNGDGYLDNDEFDRRTKSENQ